MTKNKLQEQEIFYAFPFLLSYSISSLIKTENNSLDFRYLYLVGFYTFGFRFQIAVI